MKTFGQILPKRALSQNFLIDKNIANKIVNSLDTKEGDIVIELGCGTGALTQFLIEKKIKLIGLELDKKISEALSEKFPNKKYKNFFLLNQNVLDFNINENFLTHGDNQKVKIIGNIPYSISSQIFFWLFEQANFIDKAILMVQKELAQRLTAKPKTKDYGIPTVALQLTGNAKRLFDVPPSCFYPQPAIMSSIIEINFNDEQLGTEEFRTIMKFIRAAFSQRRKTLKNSLKNYIEQEIKTDYKKVLDDSSSAGIDYFSRRAEELTKEEFIRFYELLKKISLVYLR